MNRDLLTEAIADAKAVKEMAIANAKAALEEAFTPHLKSMLSQKLQEMDEAEDKMDEAYDDSMAEMEEGYGKDKMGEMDLDEILAELEKEEMSEADEAEDKYSLNEEEDMDLDDMSEDELKKLIEDVIEDMVKAGELEAGEKFGEEEEDEEIDLEIEDDEAGEEMETEEEEISIDELLSEMESLDEEAEVEEGYKKEMEEAEKHNERVEKLLQQLQKRVIADTRCDTDVVPRDYPEPYRTKWEKIYGLRRIESNYPFSVGNVKEFIKFCRESDGFRIC